MTRHPEPPEYISVPEAAALLGVSRQRVLQALHPDPDIRRTDEILPHRDLAPPGAKRRSLVVQLAAVIEWRAKRALADEPVGPLPPHLATQRDFPPPIPELPPFVAGIGMPNVRPF